MTLSYNRASFLHYHSRVLLTLVLAMCSYFSIAQQNEIDSLKLVVTQQEGIDKINSLTELSWYFKNINIDSAFLFSNQAIDEAKELGDKKGILSAYNALANVYDGVGQLDSSEYFHKQSLQLAIEINDSSNIAASYNNLGIVYDLKGENKNSLEMYFHALSIYESLNADPYSIAMILGNIGVVYKKQKQYSNTLELYQRALDIYKNEHSEFGIMVTQGNIGAVLINLKQYKESIEISNKALEGYKNAGYDRYIPYVEHNLAVANDSLGNIAISRSFYESAIQKHETTQNFNEVALTCISFCDFLYRHKNFEEGIGIANKALKNAKEANSIELQIDALKYLAKYNSALGNYQIAFVLLEKYEYKKDSLLVENNMKQILELQAKYKAGEQERKLLDQTIELDKKEKAIQLQITLIVILFLFILLIIWRFRLRRQQQQLMTHLAMNQERNRIAMDLHDHVGAELTLVSSKLDIQSYNEKRESEIANLHAISNQIRNVNVTLRETVWSIQNETITVAELLERVETYVQNIFNGNIKYTGKSNSPGFELSPQVALNLYRICQESCTNCFKHAGASTLNLSITLNKKQLSLTIKDNGKGFDPNIKASGYGLNNMKQRVAKINGTMDIKSSLGNGVNIIVELALIESSSNLAIK